MKIRTLNFTFVFIFCFSSVVFADLSWWPPREGDLFPDIEFTNQNGRSFKMSSLSGKVVLVEYVGMPSPASQAFAGGNERGIGAYEGGRVQDNLESVKRLLYEYGKGLRLGDRRIAYVAILLFDMNMEQPTKEDARRWASHFGFSTRSNAYVVVADEDLRKDRETFHLIPGFQLLDRRGTIRSDSAGQKRAQRVYNHTIPLMYDLASGKKE